MIRSIELSVADHSDETGIYYEPPTLTMTLSVIGGTAHLDIHRLSDTGIVGERVAAIHLPATSLQLALSAAIADDEPLPGQTSKRTQQDRPTNSHKPWTEDLDTQLRDTWLACVPSDPEPVLVAIADAMGRSRQGIRSRLTRLGCDPDVPGRLFTGGQSEEPRLAAQNVDVIENDRDEAQS